jgi:NADH-quinone oxidoreductase subunit E
VTAAEIRAHIDPMRHEFAEQRSLILPALRFAQREKGYLTLEDLEAVAEATDLTPAYVEGVATFYDRLYLRPVGRWVLSVCVTLPCMLRGSDELLEHLCDRLGLEDGHGGGTTEDGLFTLQEAQCLGACDRAPAMQVNAEDMLGPTTPEEADRLLERLREAPAPDGFVR